MNTLCGVLLGVDIRLHLLHCEISARKDPLTNMENKLHRYASEVMI